MIELNINTGIVDQDIKIELESIGVFNRNKSRIENMLTWYTFELNTERVRNEIKDNILRIMSTDIINIRKEKLKKLNDICGIYKIKKHQHNDIILNIEILKTN